MIARVTAAQLKTWHNEREEHYIYRCYDADGWLLYIGCTADVRTRMWKHQYATRPASILLRQFMDHHEVDADVYRGVISGHAAEKAAIRAERPVFNLQHTGTPISMRNERIAQYIFDRTGRWVEYRRDVDGFETCRRIETGYLTDFFARAAA